MSAPSYRGPPGYAPTGAPPQHMPPAPYGYNQQQPQGTPLQGMPPQGIPPGMPPPQFQPQLQQQPPQFQQQQIPAAQQPQQQQQQFQQQPQIPAAQQPQQQQQQQFQQQPQQQQFQQQPQQQQFQQQQPPQQSQQQQQSNDAVAEAQRRAAQAAAAVLGQANVTTDFVGQAKAEAEAMERYQRQQLMHHHQMILAQQAMEMQMQQQEQAAAAASDGQPRAKKAKDKVSRVGGGQKWHDATLEEWDPNDYRIFCGDLAPEVKDDDLRKAFSHYASLVKSRVVRDPKSKKSKGYGFVSFKEGKDFIKALKEMDGKYIGNRPVKLRKSTWQQRDVKTLKRKERKEKKMVKKLAATVVAPQ